MADHLWRYPDHCGLAVALGAEARFYFPIATSLIISVILTLILWLINR
jgi:hypothetical protein